MSLYSTAEAEVVISEDTAQKDIRWKDTDDANNKVVRTDLDVMNAGVMKVAASAVKAQISFGDVVTAKIVKVTSDLAVTLYVNNSSDGILLTPLGTYKAIFLLHGACTKIEVAGGAADATVRYLFVGDIV